MINIGAVKIEQKMPDYIYSVVKSGIFPDVKTINIFSLEIAPIKEYLSDIAAIDTPEDGHLNLSEIRLLEEYLERSRLSWAEAWSTCLSDFNDNHYTTGTCIYIYIYIYYRTK